MANRDINIVVRGRNETAGVFASVNRGLTSIAQTARDIGKSQQALNAIGRVFAVGESVRAGFAGVSAIVSTFRGENEMALDAIERMPLGIGAIAREWRAVLEPIVGAAAAVERLNKAQAELAKTQRILAARIAGEAKGQSTLADLKREGQRIGVMGSPLLEAEFDREQAFRAADRKFLEDIKSQDGTTVQTAKAIMEQAKQNAADLFRKRFDEIDKAMLEAEREEAEKAAQKRISGLLSLSRMLSRGTSAALRSARDVMNVRSVEAFRDAPGRTFASGNAPAFESRFLRGNLQVQADPSLEVQKQTAVVLAKNTTLVDAILKFLPQLKPTSNAGTTSIF